jgi:predicted alpha/beta hydrolase family esterase
LYLNIFRWNPSVIPLLFVNRHIRTTSSRHLYKVFPGEKIGGFILVSGFKTPLGTLSQLDDFTKASFSPVRIIKFTNNRVVIASHDDTIVPYKETDDLNRILKAKLISVEKGGHFLVSDDFTELPTVYEELQKWTRK